MKAYLKCSNFEFEMNNAMHQIFYVIVLKVSSLNLKCNSITLLCLKDMCHVQSKKNKSAVYDSVTYGGVL